MQYLYPKVAPKVAKHKAHPPLISADTGLVRTTARDSTTAIRSNTYPLALDARMDTSYTSGKPVFRHEMHCPR